MVSTVLASFRLLHALFSHLSVSQPRRSLVLVQDVSKVTLRNIALGIFAIFRTVLGTIVFFTVALKMYGPAHFMDVLSPFLWQWMLVYGAVIVVGGQLCLFAGLKRSSASEVSLANSFSPVAGILAAFLILGEVPTIAQYMGGGVIICGIVLNQIGVSRMPTKTPSAPLVSAAKEMDVEVGFKGI